MTIVQDWNKLPQQEKQRISQIYLDAWIGEDCRLIDEYKTKLRKELKAGDTDAFISASLIDGTFTISSLSERIYPAIRECELLGDDFSVGVLQEVEQFVKNTPDGFNAAVVTHRITRDAPVVLSLVSPDFCVENFPLGMVMFYVNLSDSEPTKERRSALQRTKEAEIESKLYSWLRTSGIEVERQVVTSCGQRVDLWLPNHCFIELKAKSVSANDVCQCIDYASEYNIPIILSGEKITTSASRGLKGFDAFAPNKIVYVPLNALYQYIVGMVKP